MPSWELFMFFIGGAVDLETPQCWWESGGVKDLEMIHSSEPEFRKMFLLRGDCNRKPSCLHRGDVFFDGGMPSLARLFVMRTCRNTGAMPNESS